MLRKEHTTVENLSRHAQALYNEGIFTVIIGLVIWYEVR